VTISYVAAGSASAISTSALPGYPAGLAAGDRLVVECESDSTATPATPAGGWVLTGTSTTAGGLKATVFEKPATGSETGTLTITGFTGGTKGLASMQAWRSSTLSGPYIKAIQFLLDTDTSSTAFTAAGSSWAVATGDVISALTASLAPSGSYSANAAGPAIAQAGATISNTARFGARTGTNTIWYNLVTAAVTTGGTGTPSFSATGVGANSAGVSAMIVLTETAPNVPPVANAGSDQTGVIPGTTVTLNGSGSTDSDGTITTYDWLQISGAPTVTLSGTGSNRTFTAPGIVGPNTLVFQLTVTDNLGSVSAPDMVSITMVSGQSFLYDATAGTWKLVTATIQ
jgi:K319-like protein